MLYEEGVSASTDKVHVATVVAHEIAHQWFGNLVTPSWWRDLWLNEGFATYVEYVAVDAVSVDITIDLIKYSEHIHFFYCNPLLRGQPSPAVEHYGLLI